jgi:PAS domain S-box-containing protein
MGGVSGDASINVRLKSDALGATMLAETASLAVPLFAVVLVIFIALTVVFRQLVLTPLDLLKQAMVDSTPRGPVRARIVRDDEIGSLVRVYNKLVAGSRLYIRRLDQSQSQLAASERRFRDLAEVSGDWFFEMDAGLHLTFISDRFYEITGLEPVDVIGKSRQELAVENTKALNWQRHLDDLSAEREFKRFEYQLRAKAGHLVDISLSAVPLHDDNGVFVGYRGVGTDVSKIKEKERQLAEANRNFGDSVTYASSIQRGLLIGSDTLSAYFGTACAVWQPKDVVGGDFYWARTIANVQYLVFF